MESIKKLIIASLAICLVAGCGSGGSDQKIDVYKDQQQKDPYAGLSLEEKRKKIQEDPQLTTMDKQARLAEIDAQMSKK